MMTDNAYGAAQIRLLDIDVQEAHGKTVDSLRYSRKTREDILRLFRGELPQSIMIADKHSRGDSDLGSGTYAKASSVKDTGQVCSEAFDVSGQGVSGGALSVFPQNIGRSLLLLYADPGTIVVDPFAGHNSRLELCVSNGFSYVGCDICEQFMAFNRQVATRLCSSGYGRKVELHECDSRYMEPVPDAVGDFTITSPPYWDREYYGPETGQLGRAKTYKEFMVDIGRVASANYRCLKAGAFCVWFVNDFRKDGVFYLYHVDTLNVLQEAGFTPWDIVIVDLGYPIRASFASQIVEQQIIPKRHEYALIVRKPG
jgi:hypothetical protein